MNITLTETVGIVRNLLSNAGLPAGDLIIEPQPGGRNNRAYRVSAGGQSYFLKRYFRHPADIRDRFAAETAFLRFCADRNVEWTPRIIATDEPSGLALMEFVDGSRIMQGGVVSEDVDQAFAFFRDVNRHRRHADAELLPHAADMRDTIHGHLALVEGRIHRLDLIPTGDPACEAARALVASRLRPLWFRCRERILQNAEALSDRPLPRENQVLSPSDFGFHNALRRPDGRLCFVDFEYAGWDDPAKTLADFFLQPAIPPPVARYADAERLMAEVSALPLDRFAARARLLHPLFAIKWCCILLNEFLPVDAERREYAQPDADASTRRRVQLERLTRRLEELEKDARLL